MSEVKTVKLGKATVTARELTVGEIHKLAGGGEENPVQTIVNLLTTCTSVKPEALSELTPSEITPLIDAMLEVNSAFFVQMAALGMEETAEAMRKMIRSVSALPLMT